jgi:restriction endonuclease S subunit
MGQSPASDTYNKKGLGLPFYQGKTEFGEMFPTTIRVWCTKPTRVSQINDILISVRAPVGDVNISDKVYATGRGLSILRCINNDLSYMYLFYFLDYFKRKWNSKGSFFQAINRAHIELQLFPLPPLSEQERIVAEIEKQLAKTKHLKEHIIANQQATVQLLKALLHQAFEVEEEKEKTTVQQTKGKIVEFDTQILILDNIAAEPFDNYAAHPANNIQDIDWEMALMVACMKSKLGVTYGDVGLQKNVFNTNHKQQIFSKKYNFINSNYGTFSHELKMDLKQNPYLLAQKVAGNKEVYVVNPKYNTQVLDKLYAPENKEFVQSINSMLSIYEHPFINKETEKIELYNTVLKIAIDKNTRDIDVIYQGMKAWTIDQAKFKTKAEKFTKPDSKKILNLLIVKDIL